MSGREKTRGVSPTKRGNKGLYTVNARVSENRLCTGQKKVEDRSNEITAIPSLIDDGYKGSRCHGCHWLSTGDSGKDNFRGRSLSVSLERKSERTVEDTVWGFKNCPAESVPEEWEYDHGRSGERRSSFLLKKFCYRKYSSSGVD